MSRVARQAAKALIEWTSKTAVRTNGTGSQQGVLAFRGKERNSFSYFIDDDVINHGIVNGFGKRLISSGILLGQNEKEQEASIGKEAEMLRAVKAVDFQPHLKMIKQYKRVIQYDQLLEEFTRALPHASHEDAVAVCKALSEGGSVIRSGNLVYLHPDEIAKSLRTILPGDLPSLEARLKVVEKKLEPIKALREKIRQESISHSTRVNYSFLAIMSFQWILFFRLCYWDLSWDIVEPIGFFSNGLTTIISFGWFLKTRRDFTYQGMADAVITKYEKRELDAVNFDFIEYDRLKHECQRLKETIAGHHDSHTTRE